MSEWQPIDSPPSDLGAGRFFIVCAWRGEEPTVGEAYYLIDDRPGWWWANTSPDDYYAGSLEEKGFVLTHWMPLPQPPQVPHD